VALSDATAIVVAEEHGAYLFEAGAEWTRTEVLTPNDRDDFGGYNVSAALAGDVALVGGPSAGPEPDTGTIYLFDRGDDGWIQRYRFRPDDNEDRDEFGRAVAFDSDRVIVGDVHSPTMEVSWIGGAYVFEREGTGWTQAAALGTDAQDLFGTSVAVDGDTALVGAPYAEPDEEKTGAVYVYERVDSTWQRQGVLAPATATVDSHFGQSVALDGGIAVVGDPGGQGGRGSAFVFKQTDSKWVQQARVNAPDGADSGEEAEFGRSVAVMGEIAVVGAPEAYGIGRAYIVKASADWAATQSLVAAESREDAEFGAAVALSGSTVLVGAPVFGDTSAAYLFNI
jgi:hypothetical protein